MERLRQSDLHSLLAFVQQCYTFPSHAPFERFAQRLVDSLALLIPAAHVTYNEMYPQTSESYNCTSSVELSTDMAAGLWQQHMNEHPVMVHVLETTDRHARSVSEFWSQTQLHDRGLHNDFYRHYGIEDALCITIPCRMPRIIGVGWHDNRIFNSRERLIADLVRPHISQAWQNARLMQRKQRQVEMLGLGIETLGAGVIVCDAGGRVQFMNTRAQRFLSEYTNERQPADRLLPDDLLRWMRAQTTPLIKSDDAPPVRTPLILDRQNKRLTVRLLSMSGQHMLLMEEQQPPSGTPLNSFGLTAREGEVLSWIARGKTNHEIAIILEKHTATIKKHVEHILDKLGVETRTAAAAMALAENRSDETH